MKTKTLRRFLRQVVGSTGSNDSSSSYPVKISARDLENETIPDGGGVETFDTAEATEINRARLEHLDSLGLDLSGKRVLDVGCGVGHLAQFFVDRSCEVLCVDGREENISRLRSRYPGLVAHSIANVETESLSDFGTFDIVFCYGLLYHTENPIAALRNMASVGAELLLLETMICDHNLPLLRIEDETKAVSQGLRGLGSRPSPSFVVVALNRVGFKYVYTPKYPPEHHDFKFEWKNNLDTWRDGPMRSVFIASRTMLDNPNLSILLH
jgi:SAM-dependent methyltransferase